jgi:hypothetical protein
MACHNNAAEHVAGIGHSVANTLQNFPPKWMAQNFGR